MKNYNEMTKDELLEVVKELNGGKKYGLVWEDKPEDVVEQCKEMLPVLEEVSDRAIEKNTDGVTNLLIEGDNYHALSVLNYTHAGKIDVIYIDPPYNSGEKDFRYNDRFVDKDDPYRHSKWLAFMEKRLASSRKILKQRGIICISINDQESAQLRMLCDKIFGEYNFLGTLTWINKTKPVNSGKAKYQIQQNTEYVFVYSNCKKQEFDGFNLIEKGERKYSFSDEHGEYRMVDIEDSDRGRKKRDTMKFEILGILPGIGKRWKIGEKEVKKLIQENRIVNVDGKVKKKIYKQDETGVVQSPFWSHLVDTGTAENGKAELSSIVGEEHGFDTVKPLGLMREILDHFNNDIVILDYFAGSGTTAHAVLDLNKEDGGNRQFILCTNNENGIAEEVTYPRVKNVIEGHADVEGIPANLRYFKTAFVQQTNVSDDTRRELVEKSTEMICVKEGAYKKVYDNKKYKVYKNNDHITGILFDVDSIKEFKEKIGSKNMPANLYIFSLSNDTFDNDFEDLDVDHTLCPIPESILEVYRKLFA